MDDLMLFKKGFEYGYLDWEIEEIDYENHSISLKRIETGEAVTIVFLSDRNRGLTTTKEVII